jgi:hypothetical protein
MPQNCKAATPVRNYELLCCERKNDTTNKIDMKQDLTSYPNTIF